MSRLPSRAPTLGDLLTSARDLLALDRELFSASEPAREVAKAQQLARLTEQLARGFAGELRRLAELEAMLAPAQLIQRLLELPLQLSDAAHVEPALAVARALAFIAPDMLHGDEALILARAGRRTEALQLVSANLTQAKDIPSAEAKAGDTYRALGETDSAEAYYRRSLAVSNTASDRTEAMLRLVSLLSDAGREADASALLRDEQQRLSAQLLVDNALRVRRVGRNDPCPCASGKKYKKCHGAKH